jgi:hypothetical protein
MAIAFFAGNLESTLAARGYPRQARGTPAGGPAWADDDRVLPAIDRIRTTAARS